MDVFAEIGRRIVGALETLKAEGKLPADLSLANVAAPEEPRDLKHGDMATNAAMVLAKGAGMKPRDIAEALAERLRADPDITKVDVAGPGFINITLGAAVLAHADRGDPAAPGAAMAARAWGRARASTSSTCRPTRPGRCTSGIVVARCSAMRWRACCSTPATR